MCVCVCVRVVQFSNFIYQIMVEFEMSKVVIAWVWGSNSLLIYCDTLILHKYTALFYSDFWQLKASLVSSQKRHCRSSVLFLFLHQL